MKTRQGALAGTGPVDAAVLRLAAGEVEPEDAAPVPTGSSTGALDAAAAELETRMLREALAASGGKPERAGQAARRVQGGLIKKLDRLGLR